VFSLIPNHLPLALRSPRVLIAIGCLTAAAIGYTGYVVTRRKPTPEELERERRDLLASTGRITDGTIMDTLMSDDPIPDSAPYQPAAAAEPGGDSAHTPQIIVYNYRIAGVTYECAQDVTTLAEHVHGVRTDLPVQVRYEPHNPANSIVVAASWNGLRLTPLPIQERPVIDGSKPEAPIV
jgi:hypothetical protein